ncbi:FG-GAP-like repeat-containing protein [Fontivita pretiosa]|uniref:FG-GAP-like repeat-containing protein n=1 Tax=Fontivita pretiosa TaxID=2989684 RepID=UPI003D17A42A
MLHYIHKSLHRLPAPPVHCEHLEARVLLATAPLAAGIPLPLAKPPQFITRGDFNRDGQLDLLVSSFDSPSLSLFPGNADIQKFAATTPIDLPLPFGPDFVAVRDLNHDNLLDIVATSFNAGLISVLSARGNFAFASASFRAASGARSLVFGDFNNDGHVEIALTRSFEKVLSILPGNGDGTFRAAVHAPLDFIPSDLVVADFNRDGRSDLAGIDFFADRLHILLGSGRGSFARAANSSYPTGAGPTSIAATDLNADGITDLVSANLVADNITLWLGNGDGTFRAQAAVAAGDGPTFVGVVDLDRNRRPDLLVLSSLDDALSVYMNEHADGGQLSLAPAALYETSPGPRSLIAGDFNRDGMADVAVVCEQGRALNLFLSDNAAPTASLRAIPTITASGGTRHDFSVVFRDDAALKSDSIDGLEIVVTGPQSYRQRARLVRTVEHSRAAITATYRVTPPARFWKPADNGSYRVELRPRQVTDTAGNAAPAAHLGNFSVAATDAGNSLAAARSIGRIGAGTSRLISDYLGPDDRNDFFGFTLRSSMRISLAMSGMIDDVGLQLLDARGNRLAHVRRAAAASPIMQMALAPGQYIVRVIYAGSAAPGTGYRLQVSGSAIEARPV